MDPASAPGRGRHAVPLLFGALLLLSTAVDSPAATPSAPIWGHDAELGSSDGYAQLEWSIGEDLEGDTAWVYHLQEGRQPVFDDTDVQYMGPQHSSFVSGLENGSYYYRVRARHPDEEEWGPWSEVVHVSVQHHSRRFALGLMSVGGLVFLITAGFLIAHRNDPVPTGAPGGPGS